MANPPAVLGPTGQPIPSGEIARIRGGAGRVQRGRMGASLGGSAPQFFPYDSAEWSTTEMGDWLPWIRSPDTEINLYRDRITARARDLYRNDSWANGAINRILDSTIGSSYRLVAKPDYRALSYYSPAFDAEWADEFRRAAEARWRTYSEDLGHYNDVTRKHTVAQQWRLCLAHKLVDGESLLVAQWREDRMGRGRAAYATCFQGIDPDRLSNPYQQVDTAYLRGGVEIDDDQVCVAYHIRRAHQNDWYNALQSMEWDRVEREDPDGWRRVYHDYDPSRFEQHRGVSVFAPAISRLKMLSKLYGVKLQAETVASQFGLYVVSPFDVDMVRQALESDEDDERAFGWYQDMRADFHRDRDLTPGNGVKVATLAPGEKIESVAPGGNAGEFSPFTHEMLRSFSVCLGTSAEEVHNDYSDSSWSSARAGIVQSEKTYARREQDFRANTCTPMYATWLEEPFERGELPLPRNAPPYREMMTAYSRSRWLGTARGWVDPVAERQGVVLGLDAGLSTLEEECARQGMDWEENLEQRGIEFNRMKALGLPRPEWMGSEQTATDASSPPQKPEA